MAVTYKIYQSEYPYHIYNRVNNKEHLFDLSKVFPIFLTYLNWVSKRTDFRPSHFILMNNHYHLIGSTPRENLFEFMRIFQTLVGKTINKILNRQNHLFGTRYGATVIKTDNYLGSVIRYVYQNPVHSGNVNNPLTYPYSTLKFYLNDTWKLNGLYLDPYLENISLPKRKNILKELVSLTLDKKNYEFIRKDLRQRII